MLSNFIKVNIASEEVDITNNQVELSNKPAKLLNMFNATSLLGCTSKSIDNKTVTLNVTELSKVNVTYIY